MGFFNRFHNAVMHHLTSVHCFCSSEHLVKVWPQASNFTGTKFTHVQCVWHRSLFLLNRAESYKFQICIYF